MLLYIIRHGDPIYSPDSLTEKGKLQAAALAKRLVVHGLDKIYSSPMIRARQTAQPTCDLLSLEYSIEEWTSEDLAWRELSYIYPDGKKRWCFETQNTDVLNDDTISLGDKWYEADCFKAVDGKKGYQRIADSSDKFLKRHGYERKGSGNKIIEPNDDKIAVFCHAGFGTTWISHLLQIPPHIFWSGFSMSHSSISIFELRNNENGITAPKCLCFSDTSHIYREGLPLIHNNVVEI